MRLVTLVGLGARLARRGPIPVVSCILAALTALALAIVGIVLARRGADAPVYDVPLIASSALAWGGGFLLTFAASASVLRRDITDGTRFLFRTHALRPYLVARMGGLALLVLVVVGGGTLVVGLASVLAAKHGAMIPRTLQATLASCVFAFAFAVVVVPIAFAALGARERMSGYLYLLALLVVPAVLAEVLEGPIPVEVTELCSLPTALGALRSSLAPGTVDPFRFVRAIVALFVFVGLAVVFVRRDLALLESEGT